MVTLLTDRGMRTVDAHVDGKRLWLDGAALEAATGWAMKPQGLCRDELCIPLPPGRQDDFVQGGRIDAASVWRHLDNPIVHDDSRAACGSSGRGSGRSARPRWPRSSPPTSPCRT
jgi:hypothetical protein